MEERETLKAVLERFSEAEKILKKGIERGTISFIERDILLEKLRTSYEMLLFNGKFTPSKPIEKVETPEKKSVIKIDYESAKKEIIISEKDVAEEKIIVDSTANSVSAEKVPELTEEKKEEVLEAIVTTEHDPIPTVEPTGNEADTNSIEIIDEVTTEVINFEPSLELQDTMEHAELEKHQTETVEPVESNGSSEKTTSPILGEKYQGKKKFRNETLAVGKKDMATKLQNKPILDLTKAIGINDKFMFTKELFNGNAELYARTIRALNEFTDINDAFFYIQEHFSWDDKNEAANQLMELVRRKLLQD